MLVILAILAAVLIPSLIGYIDKAKQRAVIAEARDVWTASQAALSECYAMYPESFAASCKFSSTIGGTETPVFTGEELPPSAAETPCPRRRDCRGLPAESRCSPAGTKGDRTPYGFLSPLDSPYLPLR